MSSEALDLKHIEKLLAYKSPDRTKEVRKVGRLKLVLAVILAIKFALFAWVVVIHMHAAHLRDLQARETEAALSASSIGQWSLDLDSGKLEWNAPMRALFDVQGVCFNETYEAFLQCLAPEDKGWVDEACRTSIRTGKPYAAVYRLVTGKYIWAMGNKITVLNGHKKFSGFCIETDWKNYTGHVISSTKLAGVSMLAKGKDLAP
jgi:hypothetical protein